MVGNHHEPEAIIHVIYVCVCVAYVTAKQIQIHV